MIVERPICILVCALGGEGGGVLSQWLIDAARRAHLPAQASSVPGVAQRTGATTYYLEFLPVGGDAIHGKRPIFALSPTPGQIDLLISSELLETARQITLGATAKSRTHVISSTARALTTNERMALGDGRMDDARLLDLVRANAKSFTALEMDALARTHDTIVSAVMLGAIAASGVLPIAREMFEAVIGEGKSAQASRAGFTAAYTRAAALMASQGIVPEAQNPPLSPENISTQNAPHDARLNDFPDQARTMITHGVARMTEYQSEGYAKHYLERLRALRAVSEDAETISDTARWLALWMAYDDIARVAQLKLSALRIARVRGEVKAGALDVVKIYDHFKPGIPEIAGMLPKKLAARLRGWDARRIARGEAPFARAIKLPTHSVRGMLMLRLLCATRRLRTRSSRFHEEQLLIDAWLQAVVRGARTDLALGRELARCGQLIKGYGTTNERGKSNLLHIIQELAMSPRFDHAVPARVEAIRAARIAALTDEAGKALDATLIGHGAQPRPIKAQPIQFVRKRPSAPVKKG